VSTWKAEVERSLKRLKKAKEIEASPKQRGLAVIATICGAYRKDDHPRPGVPPLDLAGAEHRATVGEESPDPDLPPDLSIRRKS
jgi:hypothetical protein